MIHLSVAIGRFVEALFFAILRVAGVVTLGAVAAAVGMVLILLLVRRLARGRS